MILSSGRGSFGVTLLVVVCAAGGGGGGVSGVNTRREDYLTINYTRTGTTH